MHIVKIVKRIIYVILRDIHIVSIFGLIGAWKYIYYYGKIRRKSSLVNTGKKIELEYGNHSLIVRKDSTDLILAESILVGNYIHRKWVGEYNQVDEFIKKLLMNNSVPVIVDIGANIGIFSRLMLKKYPNAKIYAIEPEKKNYQILEINMQGYNAELTRGGYGLATVNSV